MVYKYHQQTIASNSYIQFCKKCCIKNYRIIGLVKIVDKIHTPYFINYMYNSY